ncbi:gamma-tubulin complex component 4-like [Chrysoperla carnea]|uniref:gamma-tubulin complex component 4-like n=1 Tax=Chrysoperla carnea TaxID=189513 RepID=UPI001D093099|nr:gamma-tubulin complex component 4-like [Chrysoperla carnea]
MILNDPRKSLYENKNDQYFNWKSNVEKYYKKLYELEGIPFDVKQFQEIVDPHYKYVTEQLSNLLLEEGKLLLHLQIIREYLLMSRGDFFHEFIQLSKLLLRRNNTEVSERALNKLYEQAWYSSNLSSESPPEGITLFYQAKNEDDKVKNAIRIKYLVSWPLQVLYYGDIISAYGYIFNFLLRIKNVQININQLWLYHVKNFKNSSLEKNLYKLRYKCAYLLDNLQYYLQVDVIETNYSSMIQTIKNTKDFRTVVKAHEDFITAVCREAFIFDPTQEKCIETWKNTIFFTLNVLIDTIDQFCTNASIWTNPLNLCQNQEVDTYNNKINDLLICLYRSSEELHLQGSDKQITRLISRMDLKTWLHSTTNILNNLSSSSNDSIISN